MAHDSHYFGGRLNSNELLLKIRKIAIRVLISSFEYYILYHIMTSVPVRAYLAEAHGRYTLMNERHGKAYAYRHERFTEQHHGKL